MSGVYNWPQPGCVGLWHFQDNGNDDSGASNDATSVGPTYALGKFGKGAVFTANYFSMAYVSSLKVTSFTIMAWYKGTSTAAYSALLHCGGITVPWGGSIIPFGYVFSTQTGNVGLTLESSSYHGPTAINDGKWHFIAATLESGVVARIYVDGRIDFVWSSPPGPTFANNNASATIGGTTLWNPNTLQAYLGALPTCDMDELMLLNYALSPVQMSRLYAFQVGRLN